MADDSVKSMVKSLLADDPTYQCLTSSTSDIQLSGCIRDFLSRKPQYMLRIMNVLPSGTTTEANRGRDVPLSFRLLCSYKEKSLIPLQPWVTMSHIVRSLRRGKMRYSYSNGRPITGSG